MDPQATQMQITLKDVWIQQQAMGDKLADQLGRLNDTISKLLGHMEVIDNRNIAADNQHRDFDNRIRALERFRWTMAGVSVVGGIAASFVGYLIGHAIH